MTIKYISVAGAGSKTGADTANAWSNAEFQTALDDAANWDDLYIQDGTYTQAAILDIDTTAGTKTSRKRLIGVNSSWADDGTRSIIDGDSAVVNVFKIGTGMNAYEMRNLEIINATGDGVLYVTGNSADLFYFNVTFNNNGGSGLDGDSKARENVFSNCDFSNNTSYGQEDIHAGSILTRCTVIGNGSWGIRQGSVKDCIVHGNTTYGVWTPYTVSGCIIDGEGVGIWVARDGALFFNNRLTNNTTAISNSGEFAYEDNNGYYNNGTKITATGVVSGPNSADLTADGYADRASDDFTLTSADEGIGVSIKVGLLDATNTGYFTQGVPAEYASAAAPTFAGITQLEIIAGGWLKVTWAAGSGTISGYKVYIRDGSASVFSDTYWVQTVDNAYTSTLIAMEADSATLLNGTSTYHVGVRADNSGTQDSNTATLSVVAVVSGTAMRLPITVVSV